MVLMWLRAAPLTQSVRTNRFSLPQLLGCVAALLFATSAAQAQRFVEPVFLYNDGNIGTPLETNLPAAWTDVQNAKNHCDTYYGGYQVCYTMVNLQPEVTGSTGITFDGIYYHQSYDEQTCDIPSGGTPSCTTSSGYGVIQTSYVCPVGTSAGSYGYGLSSDPTVETVYCQTPSPAYTQPPAPPVCLSCQGNPIYASSGQKVEVDTDYSGVPGMDFVRTYRSDPGRTFSVTSSAFADFSQTTGTLLSGCYPGYYIKPGTTIIVGSCFPYISVGENIYQLASPNGIFIQFSGPNSAVTQNADVNERVTLITVGSTYEWQVTRDDDSVELYGPGGLLLQKTLRGGRVITYTYSTSGTSSSIAPGPGYLISQSDPFGHTLSWTYDASGQMTQMTDPAGGTYQYTYDAGGNLTGITYPDSTSKTYWYNESANTGGASIPSALTGITDENAVRFATFQYAATWFPFGVATNTQHAGGVDSYSITYDGASWYWHPISSAVVTDPLGTSRTYHFQQNLSYSYDSSQVQPAASGSGTVTASESYDSSGNLSSVTDYNGNVTSRVFDTTRNLETSRTEAYGAAQARTITTTWDSNWRQPHLITEPNRTAGFTYDSLGNVLTKTVTDTTVTPNVARTWTYTYDSYGRRLTARGPRTDLSSTTTFAYYTCTTGYQCGQLHTVTDPVGNVTTYNTYNAHGRPLTITDPNGVVTTLTYDSRQHLTSRQVGSETTSFSYWPTGLLKKVTLPDSSYVQYTYDNAHRLTQIADGAGNSIQYTLDNAGNRTAENVYDPSSTLHRTHSRAYDALNRLYQDINAAGTSAVTTGFAYDDDGNQTTINAPLSRTTSKVFDHLSRLTQTTDPGSGVTAFGYDANDNLTSVQDPLSLTTSYSYNGFGDLAQLVSPDTGTSTNTYYTGGNLHVATDARGSKAIYTYDAANRVSSVVYKDSGGTTDQTLTFGYDAGTYGKGRLTNASDANHSLSWTYDGLGRVTGKGLTVGSVTESVGYGYSSGNLTAMTTPSGQAVVYGYNSNRQITSIAVNSISVLTGVTYEPFGGVSGWTWGNSSTASRTFNTDGLISQIVTAGVTLGYSYDYANRITGISDSSDSTLTWSYGYDALDRLTGATTSAITDGWTYDANGNRLTQTGTSASTFSISSGSNQLSGIAGSLSRSYSYDAAGNTQSYGSNSFTYNNRGRAMYTSADSTYYLYNALGQMIEKSGTAGTTIFVQDESGHLIGEYDSSGSLIKETVWLGDIPVAILQPNGSGGVNIFYVHTDHLNSPRKVSRPSDNQVTWRWDADPFGTAAADQNPSSLGTFPYNLRFPGQYYQAETGLNQNWNRDYDPLTGKYVESDPIGLNGGVNSYSYVRSKPLEATDSTGLLEQCRAGLNILKGAAIGTAHHEFQCWTDATGAMVCRGYGRDESSNALDAVFGLVRGRVLKDNENKSGPGLACGADNHNKCMDDCASREWNKVEKNVPEYGFILGADCQSINQTILQTCSTQCNAPAPQSPWAGTEPGDLDFPYQLIGP